MERDYLIGLAVCKGLEPSTFRKLHGYFGTAKAIWYGAAEDWKRCVRMSEHTESSLDAWRRQVTPGERLEERLRSKGIQMIVKGDAVYPSQLYDLREPPLVLFAKGKLPFEKLTNTTIAVIGTRRASGYGLEVARWIGDTLGHTKLSVISGMALGIDAAAHRSVIEARGTTVAVLGSGVNLCYPPSNFGIYSRIIENGLLISEYPPEMPAAKHHFPERNRIIAALATGVIVVQAGEKSGALLTVDYALELGKDVYVVPGPITSNHFRGSHKLLSQGAQILLDPMDMLLDYKIQLNKPRTCQVPERWKLLYDAVDSQTHPTVLANQLQISLSHVYAGLLELELSGLLERGPDGVYHRKFV